MDINTKDCTWGVVTGHESRPSNSIVVRPRGQRMGPFGVDHFDQYFHLSFWLKNQFLEYDKYESPLGARSCHKYLVLWQDLKISINYVNHVLLVILRHMGTFEHVFNILIVQIPGLGRTLHLTKDMNDQMVEFGFQVKGESWHFAKKTKHRQICA